MDETVIFGRIDDELAIYIVATDSEDDVPVTQIHSLHLNINQVEQLESIPNTSMDNDEQNFLPSITKSNLEVQNLEKSDGASTSDHEIVRPYKRTRRISHSEKDKTESQPSTDLSNEILSSDNESTSKNKAILVRPKKLKKRRKVIRPQSSYESENVTPVAPDVVQSATVNIESNSGDESDLSFVDDGPMRYTSGSSDLETENESLSKVSYSGSPSSESNRTCPDSSDALSDSETDHRSKCLSDGNDSPHEEYEYVETRIPLLTDGLVDLETDDDSDSDGTTQAVSKISNKTNVPTVPKLDDRQLLLAFQSDFNLKHQQQREGYEFQKKLSVKKIKEMQREMASRPDRDHQVSQPEGFKLKLLTHQLQGLSFMIWRESLSNPGGIIADEMGLGKTALAIALIVHQMNIELSSVPPYRRKKTDGGTLIVVPAYLIEQWFDEIAKFSNAGFLKVCKFHGANRERNPKRLAYKFDVVITSYKLVSQAMRGEKTLFKINWDRVILDEGQSIRNLECKQAEACILLKAAKRWVFTGTPIQNKEFDLYALFKFLKCSPFDIEEVWIRIIGESRCNQQRLNFLLDNFMLRRTKQQLEDDGAIEKLPKKVIETKCVEMSDEEQNIHDSLNNISRDIFERYILQRETSNITFSPLFDERQKKFLVKLGKSFVNLIQGRSIHRTQFFSLFLRLRQVACHPSLILNQLSDEDRKILIDNIGSEYRPDEQSVDPDSENSNEMNDKSFEDKDNVAFDRNRPSSKINYLMPLLEDILKKGEKVIVVSFFTGFLDIISKFLDDKNIDYHLFTGNVSIIKRNSITKDFNDPQSSTRVMLMSMLAGNLGLSLAGANNMIIMDVSWNPQQERQAIDRIHRLGQKFDCKIMRLICVDSIEERILEVQKRKIDIAERTIDGGTKFTNSLNDDEMRQLLNMGSG